LTSYGYREIDAPFIKVMPIRGRADCDLLLKELDKGKAETIILAKEVNATRVLIDENIGYKLAKKEGLNVVRTLSILLKAKEVGLISALKSILDEMVDKGRWYSQAVYQSVLERANET